ncbi:MAG: gamma-glutamyl-gamma-aminobutyrate hydrolase family protein [Succinivibrio sp.]
MTDMTEKKPLIGLLPLYDESLDSIWMLPGYQNGVHMAGADTVILPYTKDCDEIRRLCRLCDGFLFTGGQDVDPALYHEQKLAQCGEISETLDILTKAVFDYATDKDRAVLGICRGCQIINVLFGGSLYQDLYSQRKEVPGAIDHHQNKPYSSTSHKVTVTDKSYLKSLLNTDVLEVNSIHHQAIKDLGSGLMVNAVSEDGLVEAVKADGFRYIFGVQWHPEYDFHKNHFSSLIFKDFIKSL